MQSIIQIKIFTSNIIDLSGAGLFKNTAVRYVEPAVNRQPGFRRELVEQSATWKSSFMTFPPSEAIGIGIFKGIKISVHVSCFLTTVHHFSTFHKDTVKLNLFLANLLFVCICDLKIIEEKRSLSEPHKFWKLGLL